MYLKKAIQKAKKETGMKIIEEVENDEHINQSARLEITYTRT